MSIEAAYFIYHAMIACRAKSGTSALRGFFLMLEIKKNKQTKYLVKYRLD